LPAVGKQGMFRRVGQFELSESWLGSHPHKNPEAFKTLSRSTKLLDNWWYVSRHKHGQYTICIGSLKTVLRVS
jgi:hypothetical protein